MNSLLRSDIILMIKFFFGLFIGLLCCALTIAHCPTVHTAEDVKSPRKNLWNELSKEESIHAIEALSNVFSLYTNPLLTNDILDLLTVWHPNKSEALNYIDFEGVDMPERYAKATIIHGDRDEPIIKSYIVGPLLSESSSPEVHSADFIYTNPHIPWNARRSASPNESRSEKAFIDRILKPISDIIESLLDKPWNYDNYFYISENNNGDGSRRRLWLELSHTMNSDSAMFGGLTGFHLNVDLTGRDPSKWELRKIVYDDNLWNSTDDLRKDFDNGKIKKLPQYDDSKKQHFSRERPDVKPRDLEKRSSPRSISLDGLRYRVDRDEQYTSWLDWTFYWAFNIETGVSIHDIRFKGEKIAYSISLEEAISHYASNTPTATNAALLDRGIPIGGKLTPLIRGYDCSEEATYFSTGYFDEDKYKERNNTVCLFETDFSRPTSRHWGLKDFSSTKASILILRSISTVGNYDYMIDYTFYPDGSIETSASASGYLLMSHWNDNAKEYGTKVSDSALASLHDHVILFRFDLDVAGIENTIQVKNIDVVEDKFFWQDENEEPYLQKKINSRIIQNEDESKINWPNNMDKWFLVGDLEQKNKFGNNRAYRIMPSTPVIHDTVSGKTMRKNAEFSKYHLYATKFKEEERTASSMYNMMLPDRPPVDFSTFFDSDDLVQTDLVFWANVGMHHLPRAEDVPVTLFLETKSGIMLSPNNFGKDDVSRDLTNAIYAYKDDEDYNDNSLSVNVYNEDSCVSDPYFNIQSSLY